MVKKKNSRTVSKTKTRAGLPSLAEKTEKILLTMPKIIATQIGKDLSVQKNQENKLNLELKNWNFKRKN